MSTAHILVTRPAREAARWVQALQAHGLKAQALPLIEIRLLPAGAALRQAWADLDHYHAVMFVSANAVAGFIDAQPPGEAVKTLARSSVRCWATGPATAQALLQAGVPGARVDAPGIDAPSYDSEALWQGVHGQLTGPARVLVVRGTDPHNPTATGVGRDWLTQQLQRVGVQVDTVVSYERRSAEWSAEQSQAVQALWRDSIWVMSSSEAVGHLQRLLPGQDFAAARAVATHARIAQAAQMAGFGSVLTAHPSVDAVARSIKSLT